MSRVDQTTGRVPQLVADVHNYYITYLGLPKLPIPRVEVVDGLSSDGLSVKGKIFISSRAALQPSYLPLLVAHEVAHQWWGGLVPRDMKHSLHESLADYFAYLWIRHTKGTEAADECARRIRGYVLRGALIGFGAIGCEDYFVRTLVLVGIFRQDGIAHARRISGSLFSHCGANDIYGFAERDWRLRDWLDVGITGIPILAWPDRHATLPEFRHDDPPIPVLLRTSSGVRCEFVAPYWRTEFGRIELCNHQFAPAHIVNRTSELLLAYERHW